MYNLNIFFKSKIFTVFLDTKSLSELKNSLKILNIFKDLLKRYAKQTAYWGIEVSFEINWLLNIK